MTVSSRYGNEIRKIGVVEFGAKLRLALAAHRKRPNLPFSLEKDVLKVKHENLKLLHVIVLGVSVSVQHTFGVPFSCSFQIR